jgi:DnaD/phage-associated family protein
MTDYFTGWAHSDAARRDSIDLKRVYIDLCGGNMYDAVMLAQIVYWHEPKRGGESKLTVEREGQRWLAKEYSEWYEECRINERTARQCVSRLEKLGVIVKRVWHFQGQRRVHLRIEPQRFQMLIEAVENGTIQQVREQLLNDIRSPLQTTSDDSCKGHDMSVATDTSGQLPSEGKRHDTSEAYTKTTRDYESETTAAALEPAAASRKAEMDQLMATAEDLAAAAEDNPLARATKAYTDNIGLLTPIVGDLLKRAVDDYPDGWIIDAITEAATHNVRRWAYVERILERWARDGRDAPEQTGADDGRNSSARNGRTGTDTRPPRSAAASSRSATERYGDLPELTPETREALRARRLAYRGGVLESDSGGVPSGADGEGRQPGGEPMLDV